MKMMSQIKKEFPSHSALKKTNLYLAMFLAASLFSLTMGSMEFEAFRLIQYSTSEGQTFGSLSNSINFAAAHPSGDVFRKVVVVRFDELYPTLITDVVQKNALGLLVILPSDGKQQMSIAPKQLKVWEDIQNKMASETIAIPVYFAYETNQLFDLHAELKREAISRSSTGPQRGFSRMFSGQAEYMMVLNLGEPKQLTSINLDVFYVRNNFNAINFEIQGQINFKQSQDQSDQNPLIAISTSFDALAISPELSYSLEASGSSLLALLQTSKIFSTLLSELQNTNNFNFDLLFILTPTGSLNHEGTARFLEHIPSNVRERIKFAVCLDTLINNQSPNEIFVMQGQLSDADSTSKKFVAELQKAAAHKNVKVTVKEAAHSFSPSKRFIQYENQIFNDKGIPALTLSSKGDRQSHRFQKYSLFDQTISPQSYEQLTRNILIFSEALVHLVYQFHDQSITYFIDNQSLISDAYLHQITNFLSSNPRAPHMLQRDSPLSKEFQRLLSQNIVSGVKRMGVLIKDMQFYEEKLNNKIQFYLVTSKLQELYVFLGVIGYLIAMYLGLQALTGSKMDEKKAKSQ